MKREQIVVGGYYAIANYANKNNVVYRVKDIKRRILDSKLLEDVLYDYYDSEGNIRGYGKLALNAFAESVVGRVKPRYIKIQWGKYGSNKN